MPVLAVDIPSFVLLAGIAQVILAFGSLFIPRILNWRNELAKMSLLVKQIFWTYAAYILVINLCFGLISILAARELTDGSFLAKGITGFIAVYWISRIMVQFFYFDRRNFPKGRMYLTGETLLIALFIFLSGVYSVACYMNFQSN